VDGFIGGIVLAWLYNKLAGRAAWKKRKAREVFPAGFRVRDLRPAAG